MLRAGCRRSLLSRQRATGGSLFAERIQQTYSQRSTNTLSICHRLSGGCPAPSPSRSRPRRGSPQPVPLSPAPAAGFQPRNPWQPIAALRQEKHRHKQKAAFGKKAIVCSGFALKKERAELKMCQEQLGWHCFIFTKKSLLIAH